MALFPGCDQKSFTKIYLKLNTILNREKVKKQNLKWFVKKKGLDWFLKTISCLQVRASHYSVLLSPSFIFTWTAVTNNAFEICRNVSYCSPRNCETVVDHREILRKLKGQVHVSAHAHLSKCCFSAGTRCIVYAS